MARVELTRHLFAFFPGLEGRELVVEASTVAEVVQGLEEIAPGFAFYQRGGVVAFGSTTGNLYVSDDRGDSWQTVANNLPPIYSVRFG